MYSKVFRQIFDSSIAEDYLLRLVFTDFLVLADKTGIVDMTYEAISRRTNVPIEVIREKVQILLSPDPNSRNREFEGKRLELLSPERNWGWLILNFEHYNAIRNEEERKGYLAGYMRGLRRGENEPPEVKKQRKAKGEESDTDAREILTLYREHIKPASLDHSGQQAVINIQKCLKEHSKELLIATMKAYCEDCDDAKTGEQFRKNAGNFFGREAIYREYLEQGAQIIREEKEGSIPDGVNRAIRTTISAESPDDHNGKSGDNLSEQGARETGGSAGVLRGGEEPAGGDRRETEDA